MSHPCVGMFLVGILLSVEILWHKYDLLPLPVKILLCELSPRAKRWNLQLYLWRWQKVWNGDFISMFHFFFLLVAPAVFCLWISSVWLWFIPPCLEELMVNKRNEAEHWASWGEAGELTHQCGGWAGAEGRWIIRSHPEYVPRLRSLSPYHHRYRCSRDSGAGCGTPLSDVCVWH